MNIIELSNDEKADINGGFFGALVAGYVLTEIANGIYAGLTTDCDTYKKPGSPFLEP